LKEPVFRHLQKRQERFEIIASDAESINCWLQT